MSAPGLRGPAMPRRGEPSCEQAGGLSGGGEAEAARRRGELSAVVAAAPATARGEREAARGELRGSSETEARWRARERVPVF